jgi:hypothetical protein
MGEVMTSSANDEWDHGKLTDAIKNMDVIVTNLKKYNGHSAYEMQRASALIHAIDFIEYNMREMEITGGNGDL